MKFIYLAKNIQLGFRKFKSKFNFKFIFFSTGEKWEHSTRIVHANTQNAVARHCCAHVCECVFSSFNTKRNFALISFRPLATLQPKMENEKKQTNELYDHLHYEWPNRTREFFVCARTVQHAHTVIYLEFQFEQVTRNQMLQIFDVDHFR